jgi:Tn3 transposase DDE domain
MKPNQQIHPVLINLFLKSVDLLIVCNDPVAKLAITIEQSLKRSLVSYPGSRGRLLWLERCNRTFPRLALRGHGIAVEDEALAHFSPIGWEHVNLTGDYNWQASGRLRKGSFRPLRPFTASNE